LRRIWRVWENKEISRGAQEWCNCDCFGTDEEESIRLGLVGSRRKKKQRIRDPPKKAKIFIVFDMLGKGGKKRKRAGARENKPGERKGETLQRGEAYFFGCRSC